MGQWLECSLVISGGHVVRKLRVLAGVQLTTAIPGNTGWMERNGKPVAYDPFIPSPNVYSSG